MPDKIAVAIDHVKSCSKGNVVRSVNEADGIIDIKGKVARVSG